MHFYIGTLGNMPQEMNTHGILSSSATPLDATKIGCSGSGGETATQSCTIRFFHTWNRCHLLFIKRYPSIFKQEWQYIFFLFRKGITMKLPVCITVSNTRKEFYSLSHHEGQKPKPKLNSLNCGSAVKFSAYSCPLATVGDWLQDLPWY